MKRKRSSWKLPLTLCVINALAVVGVCAALIFGRISEDTADLILAALLMSGSFFGGIAWERA